MTEQNHSLSKHRVVSLFSGCGGMDLGFLGVASPHCDVAAAMGALPQS